MQKTTIQWTDWTANPIRARRIDGGNRVPGEFCQKISAGCLNCYASKLQRRFLMPEFPGTNKSAADVGVEPFLDEKVLAKMLHHRKPCRCFVCDMSDMFGAWVPDAWIDHIFAVFALTPHITWQVLTKRPERMADYLDGWVTNDRGDGEWRNPLPNVWLGTSVENQAAADERLSHLLACPAAIRFISLEPQIEAVNLIPRLGEDKISWLISGGESGPKARPFEARWARQARDQCAVAQIKWFFKQAGANPVGFGKLKDGHGGNPAEWPHDLQIREFPK